MTNYTLIQSVGTLIKDSISPMLAGTDTRFSSGTDPNANVASTDIVFDSPAEITLGANNMVSIFLYAVKPNPQMRNMPPRILNTTGGGGALNDAGDMMEPDMLLDFYYMITPYGQTRAYDFEITERIIQVFHKYPYVNPASGALLDNGNTRVVLEPQSLTLDEMNKIWSVFPNKAYRMSLFYQVPSVMVAAAKPTTSVKRWKYNTVTAIKK